MPDESQKPGRRHPARAAGGVLLWVFVAVALGYAVLLIVLGLTR